MAVVPGAGGCAAAPARSMRTMPRAMPHVRARSVVRCDAVIALIIPSAKVEGILATRQRVGGLWRSWGGGGAGTVCELPVRESRAGAGVRNGVLLEGAHAAKALARARAETVGAAAATAQAGLREGAKEAAVPSDSRRFRGIALVAAALAVYAFVARRARP